MHPPALWFVATCFTRLMCGDSAGSCVWVYLSMDIITYTAYTLCAYTVVLYTLPLALCAFSRLYTEEGGCLLVGTGVSILERKFSTIVEMSVYKVSICV